ncbi:MAG TPA: cysteine--tRNA ligase [Patescibacteria group bacterium]|nr:cysteine--tRNA ligase [Patescibacteria group bacterium]
MTSFVLQYEADMLRLYNSLTRKIEEFKPIDPKLVRMYTCGPTVYNFATIGNFRTYLMADLLLRTLQYNGYKTKYIMNITDVGHLTGDNLGDADTGEDRMEKAAKREHKTAWEVAKFYTEQFLGDFKKLNLVEPEKFVKATDHIQEQIELVKKLEKNGYTYTISDGVYFDTSKFKNYGQLSDLDEVKEGARVEINPEKRNPRDFALWKFSYPDGVGFEEYAREKRAASAEGFGGRRQMEWDSPWGVGFPGWHIECSAMSMKYLGETFDIHTGGIDLKSTHHPNEIAQSEAATHKKFVNYWLHGAFILVQGQKMSKSLGNIYRLYDLEKEKFQPLALRYLFLQTHYRQEMNFTMPALDAAQNALNHLREEASRISNFQFSIFNEEPKKIKTENEWEERFLEALNNDLNTPEALAVVWDMLKSNLEPSMKLASLLKMDQVLGLDLANWLTEHKAAMHFEVPPEVNELIQVRNQLRRERKFDQADQVRNQIQKMGFEILDGKDGVEVKKVTE